MNYLRYIFGVPALVVLVVVGLAVAAGISLLFLVLGSVGVAVLGAIL